jgi:hypothetical protein
MIAVSPLIAKHQRIYQVKVEIFVLVEILHNALKSISTYFRLILSTKQCMVEIAEIVDIFLVLNEEET